MRRYTIGRSPANDIVLSHSTISRQHASLEDLGDGRYRLTDLNSTSGTQALLDGHWVNATGVEVGADTKVGIGDYETTVTEILRLATGTQTLAPAPPPPQPAPRVAKAAARAADDVGRAKPRPEAADADPVAAPGRAAARPRQPEPPPRPKAAPGTPARPVPRGAAPLDQRSKLLLLVGGGILLFLFLLGLVLAILR